jgi:Fe-S-cluster containining protein
MNGPVRRLTVANCARCGACCYPITTRWTKKRLAEASTDAHDKAFVRRFWRRISRAQALAIRPELPFVPGECYYRCEAFDPGTCGCSAHNRRPPICSNFPWYDDGDDRQQLRIADLPLCSYWHDIPRHLWEPGVDPLPSPPNDVRPEHVRG